MSVVALGTAAGSGAPTAAVHMCLCGRLELVSIGSNSVGASGARSNASGPRNGRERHGRCGLNRRRVFRHTSQGACRIALRVVALIGVMSKQVVGDERSASPCVCEVGASPCRIPLRRVSQNQPSLCHMLICWGRAGLSKTHALCTRSVQMSRKALFEASCGPDVFLDSQPASRRGVVATMARLSWVLACGVDSASSH